MKNISHDVTLGSAKLVGVDGCPGGWVAVIAEGQQVSATVVKSAEELLSCASDATVIAIDIPIGLTEAGPRQCDLVARKMLGARRGSSVFPAPIRPVLEARTYADACAIRHQVEQKRMSKQAFAILPKVLEVDRLLQQNELARYQIREVHPEVSFYIWNDRAPMRDAKKRTAGKAAREALIDQTWPGIRPAMLSQWPRSLVGQDDLNDAFSALWTARRILAGTAIRIPSTDDRDSRGLPMEMWA
jgi:predicted RNase H-like nuclease